ncbi:MAG: SGNH/GDSL hydrolase family protein [Candidatus Sulfotelmatobacter sp.]
MNESTKNGSVKKKGGFLRGLGWFAAICIVLELGLRLFGYGSFTMYRPDNRLLWVPVPGRALTVVNHLPITVNDQGFRYAVDLQPKQSGEFRVMSFGDSTTQGWGVDDNSHYSALLEKMLNAGGCRREHFQVVSAGVNAYPNSLVAERLKEVIENPLYQPDVVIRAYSFNSNFENLPRLEGAARQQFLNRVRWKSLVRRSAIYNFFIEDLFRELAYYKLRHILMAGSLSTIEGNGDLDVNRFNAGLDQSLQLAQQHHAQLVLLVLGAQGEVKDSDMHPFQKAMLEFAAAHNVPVVNMIDVMRDRDQSKMYMDPAHPTAAGHQLIAQQLYNIIHALPAYTESCQAPAVSVATSSATPASNAKN